MDVRAPTSDTEPKLVERKMDDERGKTAELRRKKKNFSDGEIRQLLSLYNDKHVILNSKCSSKVTQSARKKTWDQIVHAINTENVD